MEGLLFYQLFRKRGFIETLRILNGCKNCTMVQKDFFQKLYEIGSYPNAYFRVRDQLRQYNLIEYVLDEKQRKAIRLTDKGKWVWSIIREIEQKLPQ